VGGGRGHAATGTAPSPSRGSAAGPSLSPAGRGESIVRVENVTKRFGATVAVDDVSLAIGSGEFFALLGPSGCGKTTLLRLLAGFEQPDEGEVWIGGERMAGVPPYQRPVNMMFQSYALFPHMSVAGNVGYGLRQLGLPRREIEARVARLLELLELGGLGARRPDALSGGQRQRVALARALAREPKLLLLDEPLAALDRKLRERTQLELVALQRRIGVTFVVVTHDQEEALGMATRIAVMEKGRLRQVGTPDEIYERPASRFVADFIGEANLFEGTPAGSEGGLVWIDTEEGRLAAMGAPGAVALSVRPEDIEIATDRPDAANVVAGRVEGARYRGDDMVVHVRLASGKRVRATRLPHAPPLPADADIYLSWSPQNAVALAE
jgi:putrescine transport system ATP-binding protein